LKAVFFRKDSGFPAELLGEMFTFVRNMKGKPEAMDKKNDDVIMAGAIAYTILQEQGTFVEENGKNDTEGHFSAMFGERNGQINH